MLESDDTHPAEADARETAAPDNLDLAIYLMVVRRCRFHLVGPFRNATFAKAWRDELRRVEADKSTCAVVELLPGWRGLISYTPRTRALVAAPGHLDVLGAKRWAATRESQFLGGFGEGAR
jgi:hypothetical protein